MMKPVIFESVDHALWALNRMFLGLEAVIEDGESDGKVIGLQIGVRGEFCGTMDDSKEFRELAMKMSGVWAIRRI